MSKSYLEAVSKREHLFLAPRKSTPDKREVAEHLKKLTIVGKDAYKINTEAPRTAKLDRLFGFGSNGVKIITHNEKVLGKYELITSKTYPDVIMITYNMKGDKDPHRVVFIKRAKGMEYYNPNGTPLSKAMGYRLREALLKNEGLNTGFIRPVGEISPETSFLIDHQGEFPVCADCSVMRSIHSHESNETYNTGVGANPVKKITSAVGNTVNEGTRTSATLPSSTEI